MNGITLYMKYLKINFKSQLQYRGWPLLMLHVLIIVISDPIGMILLFSRFGNIGVWTIERMLLIYAMAVTSYGIAETFCRGFDYFPWHMLRSGNFDRLLLRPKSLYVQVAASFFHIHRFSRVFGGTFAIVWCLIELGVVITPTKILILLMAMTGGVLTYMGVLIMTSGIAFFTIKGIQWINIFTNVSYHATRCPVPHMPKLLKNALTFFMPVLLISYYPASVVCGWGEPLYMGLLALPVSLVFLWISRRIWNFGVRHYKSTGS